MSSRETRLDSRHREPSVARAIEAAVGWQPAAERISVARQIDKLANLRRTGNTRQRHLHARTFPIAITRHDKCERRNHRLLGSTEVGNERRGQRWWCDEANLGLDTPGRALLRSPAAIRIQRWRPTESWVAFVKLFSPGKIRRQSAGRGGRKKQVCRFQPVVQAPGDRRPLSDRASGPACGASVPRTTSG